ncbi:MAG: heme-binding domain-containing protein [Chitinophagaceae bacterium]|nr:heme-binding domain-containing protein [Chitinophagaceae bacterium]MCB9046304.1 heme-binding domain-containing protein [Chitinophagales bacterium]
MAKKIMYGLLAVLVVIQFIRPQKNVSEIPSQNDIRVQHPLPGNVESILKRACFDCHSNNTEYPWYTNIQPVGWWLQNHINEGKEELNFSEFATYSAKKADHKLHEVVEMVEEKEMPLSSYTLIHKDAILTAQETETLINWANQLRQEIYPR